MKRIHLLVILLFTGSLPSLGVTTTHAAAPASVTATVLPYSLSTTSGATRGAISSMAFHDQIGIQNNSRKYVKFTTPSVVYSGFRVYYLPQHIDTAGISAMEVNVNYRGPLPIQQVWNWSLYDWTGSSWIELGTNLNALSGRWTLFTFFIPAPYTRFIGPSGEMRIQLQSSNATGNALIDYESISVTYLAPFPVGTYWQPGLVNSWQIQYSGTINESLDVQVYNLDGFETPKSTVDALHARGIKVMCYISAGSWENWRPDKDEFPRYVLGKTLSGWPDERWLDIRRIDILGPIMTARMEICVSKGFDGLDPDNVEGYANNPGLPLTAQDQMNYNIFLAHAAHERGLSIGLKNDLGQIPTLVDYFDWELNEECFFYEECDLLLPFIDAGKPVFNIEYDLATSDFCPQAKAYHFNSLLKHLDLDAYRVACE